MPTANKKEPEKVVEEKKEEQDEFTGLFDLANAAIKVKPQEKKKVFQFDEDFFAGNSPNPSVAVRSNGSPPPRTPAPFSDPAAELFAKPTAPPATMPTTNYNPTTAPPTSAPSVNYGQPYAPPPNYQPEPRRPAPTKTETAKNGIKIIANMNRSIRYVLTKVLINP